MLQEKAPARSINAYRGIGEGSQYRWQGALATVRVSPRDSVFSEFSLTDFEIPAGNNVDLMACRAVDRLYYCTGGHGEITLDGQAHHIEDGSFVFCGRGRRLSVRASDGQALQLLNASFPPGPESRFDLLAGKAEDALLDAATCAALDLLTQVEVEALSDSRRGPTFVLAAGEGPSFWQAAPSLGEVTVKLTPALAPVYNIAAGTQLLEPGAFVREHGHRRGVECVIAVQGRATVQIEGVEHDFSKGAVCVAGPYALHSFRNVGDEPFVLFSCGTPGGAELALAETGVLNVPGQPRPAEVPRNAETGRILVERYGFVLPMSAADSPKAAVKG
ncbi:cupin domain-containing protein [Pseudomonas japonica]|uniref:cupin domain-containing protein n=1 Tax=Pseudomonas japonica TaxID=256466 RepID=UPI003809B6B2